RSTTPTNRNRIQGASKVSSTTALPVLLLDRLLVIWSLQRYDLLNRRPGQKTGVVIVECRRAHQANGVGDQNRICGVDGGIPVQGYGGFFCVDRPLVHRGAAHTVSVRARGGASILEKQDSGIGPCGGRRQAHVGIGSDADGTVRDCAMIRCRAVCVIE